MRPLIIIPVIGLVFVGGCIVAPAPRERVVERDVVDPYGNVIERERIIEDGPPPPARVEVIPVVPYPGAIWVRGYYVRGRYGWVWVRGHWR